MRFRLHTVTTEIKPEDLIEPATPGSEFVVAQAEIIRRIESSFFRRVEQSAETDAIEDE